MNGGGRGDERDKGKEETVPKESFLFYRC